MEFDFSPVFDSAGFLLRGVGVTVLLSLLSVLGGAILGLAVGLGRCYGPRWLAILLTFYIDTMRAIPVLVLLVWVYFAFPILSGASLPPFWAALAALSFHLAAYVAEILRAGIQSVRPGQTLAGLALGMSTAQLVRKIVLPQAFVRLLPDFGSIISRTIKDTAIATVIAVPELMRSADTIATQSYRPIEVFTGALVIYFILIFPVTRVVDMFYRRVAHLGRS
ncbi:amino acid ABC transporter permease [Castellaniella defragrans]|uniref:Polar amino acid transport system permease protein n=1 Tax=Castellaniella defragrans TaxID=75697 RepID=A0A7W9WLP0_CASDE|nr:amino acid ABC transporter permease [Castellaniella defragrans]KAB0622426.1 amino acid ABC transporter permease [Castellaniella defragrans]MBB6083452.1 polar amino acid transport system permease protein [Castellaniella defragrans]